MSDLLRIGSSALLAYQQSLATTGHNIANASTPGYSRQRVELAARVGSSGIAGFSGAGVEATQVRRLADVYAGERLRSDASNLAQAERVQNLSERLDQLLSDKSLNLSSAFTALDTAFDAVAADPLSAAARQAALGNAGALVERLRTLDGEVGRLRDEIGTRLGAAVDGVNSLSRSLADLNDRIAVATARGGGQAANDLLDQRDQLLEQMSAQLGIRVQSSPDGSVDVFTADGQALVLGTQVRELHLATDPARADHWQLSVGSGTQSVTLDPAALARQGGEIGGLFEFQDAVLDPAAADLGRIAVGLAAAFNDQQAQGIDLRGAFGAALFVMPQPAVYGGAGNAGSSAVGATIGDASQVTAANLRLRYDGAQWQLSDARSGQAVAMSGSGSLGDPFVAQGLRLTVSGTPAAGDEHLIVPTETAARDLALALDDASGIAAAAPVLGYAAPANTGSGRLQNLGVADVGDPNLRVVSQIRFISSSQYTIDGGAAQTYGAGADIVHNGWRVQLSGAPAAGDVFEIRPTPAGSGDNRNARALSSLSGAGLLDGGSRSLSAAASQLGTRVAVQAQQAGHRQQAASLLQQQDRTQRDGLSGVNLDEEAANLLRFQQAYQAAAQVIAVSDRLFESLMNAVGR